MSALPAGFVAPIRRSPGALFRIRFPDRKNFACAAGKDQSKKFLRTTVTVEQRTLGPESCFSALAGERRHFDMFASSSFLEFLAGRSTPKEFFNSTAAINFASLPQAKDM